jgi:hypothetical protein
MLNFTFQSPQISGQFNGRFAFRAALDGEPIGISTLQELADGTESALHMDVLRHEYLHWLVFRSSVFGIETIGRRFRARTEFLKGNVDEVIKYYAQRTAYFSAAFDVHEAVVKELEMTLNSSDVSALRQLKLNSKQRQRIVKADACALASTIALNVLSSKIARVVDKLKGWIVTREYGLQSYVREADGTIRIREVSLAAKTNGVINAAYENNLGNQHKIILWLKGLRRNINTEGRGGGLTKEKMGLWAALKFSSEAQTLVQLNKLGFVTTIDDFSIHARHLSDFVFRHVLAIQENQLRKNLSKLISGCQYISPRSSELMAYAESFSAFDEAILYFFYIHGN